MTQHDASKLPSWARELIDSRDATIKYLQGELEALRNQVSADPEGSNTFANPYGNPQPLGAGPKICFSTSGEPTEGFIAELADGGLKVTVQTSLRARLGVFPTSGNEVTLRVVPW
jgi:hypothetical protein